MAIGGSPITIVHIIVLVIRVLICTNKNKRNDMTITESVERQREDCRIEVLRIEKLQREHLKNKVMVEYFSRVLNKLNGKFTQMSHSLLMMKQGKHFTGQGWVDEN